MAEKKDPQYYTIVFEKFIDIMTDTDRYFYMISDELKALTSRYEINAWDDSPIPDFMETCVILNSLRKFLDKKMNEPSEEEIKFCNKNNIKDVLMTREELTILQSFIITLDEQKVFMQKEYNFNHIVN